MKKFVVSLIATAALGIAGYLTYDWMSGKVRQSEDSVLKHETKKQQHKIAELEEEVSVLQEELDTREDASVPKEKIAQAFGDKEPVVPSPVDNKLSCEELQQRIASFFNYLDDKRYIQHYSLNESSQDLFQNIVTLLTENTPEITGEMLDVPILMKNMAYFYRVLGRNRLGIVRKIINREADIIEPAMITFYQYFKSVKRCKEIKFNLPALRTIYNYAVFFLHTLAGRNYLSRRDSKIRIITSYYCTLIIDRANEEHLNRYGFDIRPQIEMLLSDINDHKRLVYKKYYLEEMERLRSKYL